MVVAVSLAWAAPALADQKPAYEPATGDEVVIYTHVFKPENFEEGLKLTTEGFTAAQAAAGQTRKNDILVDRANHKIVLISYFDKGSSVEAWHAFMGRLDLLKKLEPMRSEPLKVERFKLDAVTTAP
ncbi:hypothetical protein C3941_10110 [Kaistia algarum]|nr:hypothetical protein C3941_10110 [Kaistia algarum]